MGKVIPTKVWNRLFPLEVGDYILVKGDMLSTKSPKVVTLKVEKVFFHGGNSLGINYEVMESPFGEIGVIGGSQYFDLEKDILEIIRREEYGKR